MAHEAVPGSIILTWLSVFQASRHVLQSVAVGHIKPMASGPKSSFGLILPPPPPFSLLVLLNQDCSVIS